MYSHFLFLLKLFGLFYCLYRYLCFVLRHSAHKCVLLKGSCREKHFCKWTNTILYIYTIILHNKHYKASNRNKIVNYQFVLHQDLLKDCIMLNHSVYLVFLSSSKSAADYCDNKEYYTSSSLELAKKRR